MLPECLRMGGVLNFLEGCMWLFGYMGRVLLQSSAETRLREKRDVKWF